MLAEGLENSDKHDEAGSDTNVQVAFIAGPWLPVPIANSE